MLDQKQQVHLIDTITKGNSRKNEVENCELYPGIWAGIDLGTTQSSLAIWDLKLHRPKLIRLDISSEGRRGKYGKLVPSSVLFLEDEDKEQQLHAIHVNHFAPTHNRSIKAIVGRESLELVERGEEDTQAALVSSSKRLLGKSISACTPEFLSQLPFSVLETEEKTLSEVQIQIYPVLKTHHNNAAVFSITPSQISSIILYALRESAQRSLTSPSNKLNPPGGATSSSCSIRNVVIGVPAHYTRYQRHLVELAAKKAGFDGYVGTISESTAAALAYGLLNSSSASPVCTDSTTNKVTRVLVFDMGGGTTDVTICSIIATRSEQEEHKSISNENGLDVGDSTFECHVNATSGDVALGGDDVDELLLQWFLLQDSNTDNCLDNHDYKSQNFRDLRNKCCIAKEELCGDGKELQPRENVYLEHDGTRAQLSMKEFDQVIGPVLKKAEDIVNLALQSFLEREENKEGRNDDRATIDEVVLVGGSSRIPAIRNMLRRKFPPPHPPDLCTALDACAGVAMGAATQAAIISGHVPKHEIMSALMLDALPHTIGILVEDESLVDDQKQKKIGKFVPVLFKDSIFPSSSYKTFELLDPCQTGVTIQIVEHVGGGYDYEKISDFTLLLHKLSMKEIQRVGPKRTIDVAISVDCDGNLTVSLFDWNDPEHLEKRRRYLSKKGEPIQEIANNSMDDSCLTHEKMPREQWLLLLACFLLGALYIVAKLIFHDVLASTEL
mmetsp:Transcript_23883/g.34247  ORF Transcript_23883/g.34247 Transcript_23883/m.34247 type:complete len:726 (-) Transcript_23883:486-2663(-)